MEENVNDIELIGDLQILFDGLETRYALVTGGRGGGKSFGLNTFLLDETYEKGNKTLFTRFTMDSAEDSIIPEFKEKLELLNCANDFKVNSRDIKNKESGSSVLFRGIKTSSGMQTAKLKSMQGITTFVLDEAEELVDESVFNKIDQGIRSVNYKNTVILIMNPTDEDHWVYQRWIKDTHRIEVIDGIPVQISTHPDVTHIHITYLDNLENLDQEYLDSVIYALKEKNPERYGIEIIGKWGAVRPGGEFYSSFSEGRHYEEYEYDPDKPLHISFDQNVAPYMSATLWQIDEVDGELDLILFDEIAAEHPNNTTGGLCKLILKKYGGRISRLYYYGDASGNKRDTRQKLTDYNIVEREFRKYIHRDSNRVWRNNPRVAKRGDFINEIFDGFYKVNIWIHPKNCPKTIKDLVKIKKDANGGKLKETQKVDGVTFQKWGHMSDTVDYFVIKAVEKLWNLFIKKRAPKILNAKRRLR